MKIKIWIKKEDAIRGKVYPGMLYDTKQNPNLVEVLISSNEFAKLEDNGMEEAIEDFLEDDDNLFQEEEWLVDQYNRNRAQSDWISEVDEIDQNNQPFGDQIMKKAYSKGISIISSCKNTEQMQVAKKYIENFDKVYNNMELSKKLMGLYNLFNLKMKTYEQ